MTYVPVLLRIINRLCRVDSLSQQPLPIDLVPGIRSDFSDLGSSAGFLRQGNASLELLLDRVPLYGRFCSSK